MAQEVDPFARAQQMQQQMQMQPQTAVMNNPFPGQLTSPQQSAQQQPMNMQAPMEQASTHDFDKLAQTLGLDISKLHSNPTVGKLQLMNQMQSKMGPDFMNHPQAKHLLLAFGARYPSQDMSTSKAKGERTLKALMGGPP